MLSIHRMEPLLISTSSKHYSELSDLALTLTAKSSGFKRSLPESMLTTLSELIRSMNCYYSNLIEGHHTHPIDIERALQGDYSGCNLDKQRDLTSLLPCFCAGRGTRYIYMILRKSRNVAQFQVFSARFAR